MSEVNADIDLRGLSRTRSEIAAPRRSKLRIWVPLLLLLGFAAVLATTLTDLFSKKIRVTILRPLPTDSVRVAEGSVLIQSSGWIEPEPFPTKVAPLTAGIVEEVLVQPSDLVTKGEVVARLVAADAQLAIRAKEAALAMATAERDAASAEASAAKAAYTAALEVIEKLATTTAEHAGRVAEAEHRAQAVVKAAAELKIAEEELTVQRHLAKEGASGPRQVEIAEAKVDAARGDLAIMKADAALAKAEAERALAMKQRAEQDRTLRIEEKKRVASAAAALALAEAKVAEITVQRDEAELRVTRLEVRAPIAGIVLDRLVTVGSAVSPDTPESSTICTLFDPQSLRVRMDVPQDQVAKAVPGLDARIITKIREGKPYQGRVLRVVQTADANKVTLAVHVKILDPDELLRPEGLCTVNILAPAGMNPSTPSTKVGEAVRIPTRVVRGGKVFVVHAQTGRAAVRTVTIAAQDGEWTTVTEGLSSLDRVIDPGSEQIQDGAALAIEKGG